MISVKAGVEYKIISGDKYFLLDSLKFNILNQINQTHSMSEASKICGVSYRTTLNYIDKIESELDISVVTTKKGGTGGGGSTVLTSTGEKILEECKKINAVMELHNDINEMKAIVSSVEVDKGVMNIKVNEDVILKIPKKDNYLVGDSVLALISYDNVFIMLEPQISSIRNIFKGKVVEMSISGEMIRINIDISGNNILSDITLSAQKELGLELGKEVYVGFKAASVGFLKL